MLLSRVGASLVVREGRNEAPPALGAAEAPRAPFPVVRKLGPREVAASGDELGAMDASSCASISRCLSVSVMGMLTLRSRRASAELASWSRPYCDAPPTASADDMYEA